MIPRLQLSTFGIKRLLSIFGVLVAIAIFSTLIGNEYLALVTGIPAYIILPGLLIQLAFRSSLSSELNTYIYSIGLSIVYWTVGGLFINTVLPLFGIDRPLGLAYILVFYVLSLSALAAIASRRGRHSQFMISKIQLSSTTKFAVGIAILFPIISVLGSTTLNNYGAGLLTLIMLALMCIYLVFLAIRYRDITNRAYPLIIFCIALSLLLMYSMRSWYVIGWDIHNELRIFEATLSHERWQMSYFPGNAYNACVSITILPTILSKLLHFSPEYVFKFVYQLLFAIVPVVVYSLARRYLLPILAMFAAILFTVQTWFFEQMPALARQEIGIAMFIILILALFDSKLSKRVRYALIYVFTLGLVLSHYSTAYIWLLIAVVTYVLSWGLRYLSRVARKSAPIVPWHIIVFLGLLIGVWEGPLTHTVGHAGNVASTSTSQFGQLFSPDVIKDGVQRAFIAAPSINTDKNILLASQLAFQQRPGNASEYYPVLRADKYIPKALDDHQYARNMLPAAFSRLVILASTLLKVVIVNLFSLLGIMLLLLMYLRRDRSVPPEFVALCGASYSLILLMLFLPYLQENYNLTRLYLQLFSLLAIPALVGFWFIVRKNVKYGLPIIGVSVAIALMSLTGLVDQFTGGDLRITMSQPKGTFDTFYVYTDEVYAAEWLGAHRAKSVNVYADPIANLRLQSYGNIDTKNNDIFPAAIRRNSYVFLINANTKREHSFTAFNNNTLTYNTPTDFLSQNKDLIYSSGGSQIYR